ncbi:MAG: EAL domain-containing protein [Campylobacterales bacterium]|nr:EAL domain-containing protein [Campylobacterales bacterium]
MKSNFYKVYFWRKQQQNYFVRVLGSLKFLCDNLGIKTIAEYVENEEIHKYINSIGIDYSQGYYIGKPNPKIQS